MFAMPGLRAFSLAPSRHGGGVAFDEEGIFVGGVPLLKREHTPYGPVRWDVRPPDALDAELTAVYRLPIDVARKANALALIATALNRGDRALAAIAAVQMEFPDPPLLTKGAEDSAELERRAAKLHQSGLLKFWDPAKHPRAGVPPNPGWFGHGGGEAGVVLVGAGQSEEPEELEEIKEHHPGRPTHHMGRHGKEPGIPVLEIQPPLPLGPPGLMQPPSGTGVSPRPPNPSPRPQGPAEPKRLLPFPEGLPRQRAPSPSPESEVAVPRVRGGRLGNPPVRAQNAAEAAKLKAEGVEVTHGDDEGPEEYIPGEGPGTKGSTYVDLTATDPKTGRKVRVQTIDTLADGKTPDKREQAAIDRIRSKFSERRTPHNTEMENAMSRRNFLFYATAADLNPLLSSLELHEKFQYTLMGMSTTSKVETYFSFADIPDFGRQNSSTAAVSQAYLVATQGTVMYSEEVPLTTGGVRFHVSQKLNRDTVAFWPGGRYSADILMYGQIGTISDSATSKDIHDCLADIFRARLMPIREFLVGPEAFRLGKAGVRLALSASTPPEFDLKL